METLQEIHEIQKIPVIVNLHQIELAERYATRLIGMSDGRLVFDGGRSELSADIVEEIYGMQVKRSSVGGNFRINRFQDDVIVEGDQEQANAVALLENEETEPFAEKAVSGNLI
jgi:ABC-type cobalamin/Fe3+-siderophores transport system ATPase subunit